jgi:hypothetical protein
MTKKDTIYRFNVESFIEDNNLDKTFYAKKIESENKKETWVPVTVGVVWITDGPKDFQVHISVSGDKDETLVFPITKKQYEMFKSSVGDKNRLNIIRKAAKEKLRFRKIKKSEMLVVRMSRKRMQKITEDAELCNLSLSAYARNVLEGYKPRKALSEQEAADIHELVMMRKDMLNFYSATKGVLGTIPREKRAEFIVLGTPYLQFRKYIQEVLMKFDSIINREKEA